MSQTSEDLLGSFFVRCSDVGLDCECTIFGESEDKVKDTMITHMYEYHAIIPEEMTTCILTMKIITMIIGSINITYSTQVIANQV